MQVALKAMRPFVVGLSQARGGAGLDLNIGLTCLPGRCLRRPARELPKAIGDGQGRFTCQCAVDGGVLTKPLLNEMKRGCFARISLPGCSSWARIAGCVDSRKGHVEFHEAVAVCQVGSLGQLHVMAFLQKVKDLLRVLGVPGLFSSKCIKPINNLIVVFSHFRQSQFHVYKKIQLETEGARFSTFQHFSSFFLKMARWLNTSRRTDN